MFYLPPLSTFTPECLPDIHFSFLTSIRKIGINIKVECTLTRQKKCEIFLTIILSIIRGDFFDFPLIPYFDTNFINIILDYLTKCLYLLFMPRKSKRITSRESERRRERSKGLASPFHFPRHKTSFSTNSRELQYISLILQGTGLRVSEVLRIEREHLLTDNRVLILSLKRGIERNVKFEPYLYKLLADYATHSGKIFSMPYFKVYKYFKSGKTGISLIKNNVNFSVCHSARKYWIRRQIYDLKRTVMSVVRELGWQKKTSILYYLK